MSLENMMGKMSRKEMRHIMAGGSGGCQTYNCGAYQQPCCDARDICSDGSPSGKCVRRP